jgi:hypothetical protein
MSDHNLGIPPPLHFPASEHPVVIHSTVRGVLIMLLCPLVLVGVGILGQLGEPGRVWPLAVGALGLVLFVYGLVSFPHRTSFGAMGLVRHCLLRRHELPWGDVRALERVSQPMGRTAAVRRRADTGCSSSSSDTRPRYTRGAAPIPLVVSPTSIPPRLGSPPLEHEARPGLTLGASRS